MKLQLISLDEWKKVIAAFELDATMVCYFEPTEDGIIRANWVGVNPNIEPLLGNYFTKDYNNVKAGSGWTSGCN